MRILRRVIRGRLRVHPKKLSGNIGPRTHRATTLSKTGTIIQLACSLHLCKHCCARFPSRDKLAVIIRGIFFLN